jgi:hypothetical protein
MPLFCGWFSSQTVKKPPEPTVQNLKFAYDRLLDPDYRQYSQDAEDALEQVEAYLRLRQQWIEEFPVEDQDQIVASWEITGEFPERYKHTKTWSLVQDALKCAVELDAVSHNPASILAYLILYQKVYPIALAHGWRLRNPTVSRLRLPTDSEIDIENLQELRAIAAARALEAYIAEQPPSEVALIDQSGQTCKPKNAACDCQCRAS